jgi:menaquinol-cytochrome c reductase iron-sulfur subunit
VAMFPIGETRQANFTDPSSVPWAGQASQTSVWVRQKAPSQFDVFAVNCTHLGCPVNWLAGANLFECPCHGGVYYADGTVAGGPPPHPLVRYSVRIGDSDRVQVLTRPLTQTISQA